MPVVTKQALLETFEQVLSEFEAEHDDGDKAGVEATQVCQLYCESFFMRFSQLPTKAHWNGVSLEELEILHSLDL